MSNHEKLGTKEFDESIGVETSIQPEYDIKAENDSGGQVAIVVGYESEHHAHVEQEQADKVDHVEKVAEIGA